MFLVGPSGAGKSTLIQLRDARRGGDRGRRRARRAGPRAAPASPRAEDAPQDRDRVAGLQAAVEQDGLGERGVRARGDRSPAARVRRPSIACSRSSA